MANWNTLKAAVADVIKANGSQAITGQLLQNVLNNIITNVGENATFAGIATLDTNPGAPDGPVFYLATTAGVYPNFNGLEVLDGEAIIFLWNNSAWTKKVTGFATQEKMQELEENTNEKLSQLGSKVTIPFDYEDRYINTDGTLSNKGTLSWWITGYVAIQPSSRIRGKIFTQSGVLCVAFFDSSKNYISGIKASSSSKEWVSYDVVAPTNAYYVMGCTFRGTDLNIVGAEMIITPPLDKNALLTLTDDIYTSVDFDIDGYIDPDGKLNVTISWKSTEYIKVNPGMKLKGQTYGAVGATSIIALYDQYYNIIQTIPPTIDGINAFNLTIPNGVRYVRLCTKAGVNATANFTASVFDGNTDILKYGHNLQKPYDFNGKRAVFFGDSVTYGVASQGGTIIGITDCYRKVFCDKAGLVGINKAISGSYLYCPDYDGSTPNEDSILSQVRNTITSETAADFDFVVVAGGINDFWTGKNLGTIEDNGNISVYGALKAICEHLKANIPKNKVIFLTPINYSKMQKATPYLPLSHYRNAIFEVATMNGYSVVDMSVVGFPNEPNDTPYKAAMITDGVHPTALGHRMMGENLYSILC